MEPSRGLLATLYIPTGFMLFLMLGTSIWSSNVDAYVVPLSQPSKLSTISSNTATWIIPNAIGSSIGFGLKPRSTRYTRLYSNDATEQENDGISNDESSISATSAVAKVTEVSQFGEVTPMRRSSASATTAQFGDVVSISRPSLSASSPSLFEEAAPQKKTTNKSSGPSDVELLKQRKTRNIAVALLSVVLAVGNYAYEWTHPATPIQLLVNMERSSAPLSDIGKNSKPTVIDFWAPWCENCRYMAPTLYQVEQSYKDKVNFVMLNGDDPQNWPLIEALGVDAIPHLALVESDGTVDTALIGAVPKEWLSKDLDVLLDNASKKAGDTSKLPLPYQMLDAFANRPEARKLNLDAAVDAAKR